MKKSTYTHNKKGYIGIAILILSNTLTQINIFLPVIPYVNVIALWFLLYYIIETEKFLLGIASILELHGKIFGEATKTVLNHKKHIESIEEYIEHVEK